MILYHGSTVEIHDIDLNKSARGKDFGKGFYLSENEKQAEEMAVFKSLQTDSKPIVNAFDFDERLLHDNSMKIRNIDTETFLKRLKYIKGITFQYFFGTEKAIKHLKKLS